MYHKVHNAGLKLILDTSHRKHDLVEIIFHVVVVVAAASF